MAFADAAGYARSKGYGKLFPVVVYRDPEDPGKRKKKVLVASWETYMTRDATDAEMARWSSDPFINEFAGVGLATGSGLVVVDFDGDGIINPLELQETFPWYKPEGFPAWVRSGGGGLHVYTQGSHICATNFFDVTEGVKVDLRGERGYIVGPMTPVWDMRPERGRMEARPVEISRYEGELHPPASLPPLPDVFVAHGAPRRAYDRLAGGTVPKGTRNDTATSLALYLANSAKKPEDFKLKRAAYELALATRFEDADPNAEEYVRSWETAEGKIKGEKGTVWSDIAPLARDAERRAELSRWGVEVEETFRLGDQVHVKFKDGQSMSINVADLYSQAKFRAAFTAGTNRIVPAMRKLAWETFVASLEIARFDPAGTSPREMVFATLLRRYATKESETAKERDEALSKRGFSKLNGKLFVNLDSLSQEPALRGLSRSGLANALADAGAEKKKRKGGPVWSWEPPEAPEEDEL
jgi:hypothetical protein